MNEWPFWGSCGAALCGPVKVRSGPSTFRRQTFAHNIAAPASCAFQPLDSENRDGTHRPLMTSAWLQPVPSSRFLADLLNAIRQTESANSAEPADLSSDNIRPPLLPPVMRGKALRSLIRIHTMPVLDGQSLPRRLLTCPASAAVRLAVPDLASGRSRPERQPVGFVVVFLRQPRRSRFGAGWGSPRIMASSW